MSDLKRTVLASMFIAIGIVLPMIVHLFPPEIGMMLLPMHIPVLLAGIILGFPFGLATGVLTVLLSFLIRGMPFFPIPFVPMIFELAAYGTAASLLMYFVKVNKMVLKTYISLIGAMIIGRIIFGVAGAFSFFILGIGQFSIQGWLTAAFVTAWPGIIIQLVIIPPIVIALQKARLIDLSVKNRGLI